MTENTPETSFKVLQPELRYGLSMAAKPTTLKQYLTGIAPDRKEMIEALTCSGS